MERTRLDVYEKLPSGMEKYLAEHGWNFSKKLCEYAVSKMKDRNGNKIHPYDKDQVETSMRYFLSLNPFSFSSFAVSNVTNSSCIIH